MFNSQWINKTKQNLDPETLAEYEKKGKEIYETVNFETN